MTSETFSVLPSDEVDHVNGPTDGGDDGSIMTSVHILYTKKLDELETRIRGVHSTVKDRRKKITFLHDFLQKINKTTSEKGTLDWSDDEELAALLEQARELGVEIPEDQTKFDERARQRLIENTKLVIDDYGLEDELDLQSASQMTNERFEFMHLARSIMKPYHDLLMSIIRKFRER